MPWRDATAKRPLQFNRPFFRRDGTVWHASLDRGLSYDRGSTGTDIALPWPGASIDALAVDGVRGRGWRIDPIAGLPRFSLRGMQSEEGTLEFWLRPANWDDVTGYWQHSPPKQRDLSVARLLGKDRGGEETILLNITLPRAHDWSAAASPSTRAVGCTWPPCGGKASRTARCS